MRETKTFASLSSGLLARKGGAKPAMRPQGFNSYGGSLEDLGWDDMGHGGEEPSEHVPSSVAALTPPPAIPRAIHSAEPDPGPAPQAPAPPTVIEQQNSLRETFSQAEDEIAEPLDSPDEGFAETAEAVESEVEPEVEPGVELREDSFEPSQSVIALPRRRALPLGAKAKAAFTLRLDPERHLRLRLASAITHCSAQQLVTGALDDFLNSLPELEGLAERVPAEAGKRGR